MTITNKLKVSQQAKLWLKPLMVGSSFLLLQNAAFAEAVLNPNQLVGEISFTNQNPQVLEILNNGAGMASAFVRADSIGLDSVLNNYAYPQASSPLSTNYQLTVEASDTGVPYSVSAYARLDGNGENYMIAPVTSDPLFPEPAADVRVDFKQCAGIVDVKFLDGAGNPAAVSGGNILAFQYQDNGSLRLQSQDFSLPAGITHEYITVHGNNSTYRIDALINAGSDAYSNLVRYQCRREVKVGCDEIVVVTCPVDGAAELGQIDGNVDVLGETENVTQSFTRMAAMNGPLRNYRFDKVEGGNGPFDLINLVPSAQDHDRGYTVYGELSLRSGYATQYLRTPYKDPWYNGDVKVVAGQTTHLDNTFVLNPGYVQGKITLVGSDGLADLTRDADYDYNQDGLVDNQTMVHSVVQARGTLTKATGANHTSWGGWAKASFEGGFDPDNQAFNGTYEMVLGGLHGEASVWSPSDLIVRFDDRKTPDVPESYQFSWMQIHNRLARNKIIEPGTNTVVDHEYCFNEVQLQFKTLSGLIYSPSTRVLGHFEGEDFRGQMMSINVDVNYANGTPRYQHEASDRGLVVLNLPQGEYTITPKVRAINPDGTVSQSELREVSMSVGCQQKVVITTDLQLQLDDHPAEVDANPFTLSGSVNSDGIVNTLHYYVNGVGPTSICSNCVQDVTFSTEIDLVEGDNQIEVVAIDEFGNESSVTTQVALVIPEPVFDPLAFASCPAIEKTVASYETGAHVDFALSTTGGCGETTIVCDSGSGSFFGIGSTQVNCRAVDACSSEATCAFSVSIIQEAAEEPPVADEPPVEDDLPPVEEDCMNGEIDMASSIGTNMMWPPNHELTSVGFSVSHSCEDTSTEEAEVSIVTEVWSDEPENPAKKDGSGNFAPDAKGMDTELRLRAERSGKGDGRVYLIISTDELNNFSCAVSGTPKSQSKKDLNSLQAQMDAALAHCNETGGAPFDFFKHGMSEEVGPKQ